MRRSRPAPSTPRSAKRLPSDLDRNSQEMLPVSASRISLSSRSAAHTDPITCNLFLKKGRRSPCQSLLGSQFLEIRAQYRELDSSRMRLIAGALHLSGSSTPRNSHRLMILSNETAPEGRTQRPVPLTQTLVSHQLVRGRSRTGPDPHARRTGDVPSWSHAMAL